MSIAKNYLFNVIYQVSILIIPLITIPYVSRVLGSNGIGINAYTNSIIQYFILLATIGISLYGNREVAYVRDNREELSKTFWGILILKFFTSFFAYLLFLVFLIIYDDYHFIFLLQSIYILAAAVDISWMFMGLEDFKKTIIRNLLVKLLGVFCTFIFVNDNDDLWKYVLILSSSQFIGNLTLWFYIPRTVNKIKITWKDITKHLKPSISLFIPQIAIQIYVVLNKTMLGTLSHPVEVGYFDNADKIVRIILSVVTAMGIVMLPRVANTYAHGDLEKVKEYIYKSFSFVSYISIPLMFGLASISIEFAPMFFGPEFSKTGILMVLISPIIVLISWSNVIGNQYLLPTGKVKAYTLSVVIGAIINFVLNIFFIRSYHSIGTSIATFIAELSVTSIQFYLIRKNLNIKKMIFSTWKYFVSGLIMFLLIQNIGNIFEEHHVKIITKIIIGSITYFFILFILKSELNKKIFYICIKYIRKR